jgi:gamma-butyrobetaine dioxygenase
MLASLKRPGGAYHSLLRSSQTPSSPLNFNLKFSQPRSRHWSTLTTDQVSLTVHSLNTSFPYIWLRDSCQSPTCIHPSTSQKLHRTSDIPLDIKPVTGSDGIRLADDGIHIAWTDGHKSFFHMSFLERYSSFNKLSAFHRDVVPASWNNSSISQAFGLGGHRRDLFVSYQSLKESLGLGLLSAMTQILKHGILFISGVPNTETSHEKCELRALAQLFGELRPTFYGLLWDVMNIPNSRNIAYTNLDLGLHMDLLYVFPSSQYRFF